MISAQSVAAIFKAQSIASVAIIDDAFNPAVAISPQEARTLYESFAADSSIEEAFTVLGLPLQGEESITQKVLARLKDEASSGTKGAIAAIELVDLQAKARRRRLDGLTRDLKGLGVSVKRIAATKARSAKRPVGDNVDVVLLDYDLGDVDDLGGLSRDIATRIYDQHRGKERAPLVILMSSGNLSEDDVATFQNGSRVLSGMFYFVLKDDLFEEERRNYRLAAFARSLNTGQMLQRFVGNLEAALEEAREKAFSDIRSLSIADFTYLKMLRLHDDGQPLGDYLMWLASAHLLHYLAGSAGVRETETRVNALTFDHLPPTQARPSPNLAVLYSSAVMREAPPHPADDKDLNDGIQFGDLFRAEAKVWLCITAPCDLSFSETRPRRTKRSVLFIPGRLYPIEKELSAFERRMPRTELLWLDRRVHRILWDTKEVDRADWGRIATWQKNKSATRIARLNATFALEIQRAFSADLTRIGMPVPPPLYSPQPVRLTCLDEHDAEYVLTGESSMTALSVGGERGVRLVMGEGFMNEIPAMLAKATQVLTKRRAAKAGRETSEGPGPTAEVDRAIAKIDEIRKDAELLSGIRGPFDMPEPGQPRLVVADAIALFLGTDPRGASAWTPLRLAIIEPIETIEDLEVPTIA